MTSCLLLGLLIATSGQQTPIMETLPDQAACFAHIRGVDSQRKYERMDDVPDGFILDALKELTCLPQ